MNNIKIQISEPHIVSMGPVTGNVKWGPYQFPTIYCAEGGILAASVHNAYDTWAELGTNTLWFMSRDNGVTWDKTNSEIGYISGTLLPNGDRLFINELPGINLSEYETPVKYYTATLPGDKAEKGNGKYFPYPRGMSREITGGSLYVTYLIDELPDGIVSKTWRFGRLRNGVKTEEISEVRWPYMSVNCDFSSSGKVMLAPYPLGKIKIEPNTNTLWTATYNCFGSLNPVNGGYSPFSEVFVLRSYDFGHSWDQIGYVPYKPDNIEYNNAFMCGGFSEPTLEFMPDGSMIMLLRCTAVQYGDKEWAPSWFTRSTDKGKTWSKPVKFDEIGVLPKMVTLPCGVTLAVYGRPGIFIRATNDPQGIIWDAPVEVMTPSDRSGLMNDPPARPNFHQWAGSCCNCDITVTGYNKAIMIYSDFYIRGADDICRKTILTREITVIY